MEITESQLDNQSYNSHQYKREQVDPADHRINLKESEKKDKYMDLAREMKKLRNMKVTVIPILMNVLGLE